MNGKTNPQKTRVPVTDGFILIRVSMLSGIVSNNPHSFSPKKMRVEKGHFFLTLHGKADQKINCMDVGRLKDGRRKRASCKF